MSIVSRLYDPLEGLPFSISLAGTTLLIYLTYLLFVGERPVKGIPEITLERDSKSSGPAHQSWLMNARAMVDKGLRECSSCFQILTGTGYKVVIPNRFADELRNHPDLSLTKAFTKEFFSHYPGFEAQRESNTGDGTLVDVVRVKLTQSLGLITDDLVDETNDSMHDILGENKEWETKLIKQDLLDIVARLSSRVFMGKDLCRDPDWLRVSKGYTVDIFGASRDLRACSPLLRPIQYWFIPSCTRLRQHVRDAHRLITPEVKRRRDRAEKAITAGGKPQKVADTIGWMVEMAKGRPVDYVSGQLGLTMAAIHTTSETTSNCIATLCEMPELIEPLRKEMIDVLKTDGWSKLSLYKMRLLDSFLKEVQRVKSLSFTSMNRKVEKQVTLSDGTILPAGTRIMVTDDKANNEEHFPNPDKIEIARFLNLREQPGEENRHQYVTPTSNHMGFGYGQHACPGRFFVSNEIKIAMCFLLLKYDFRFPLDEKALKNINFESGSMVHPMLKVQMRRRKEEIDLMAPQA